MATHSSILYWNSPVLENPMDGGAWQATVRGVAKSKTRPSNFTFTLQKKIAHLIKYFPPLKCLVAIFRDLNDFNVFKACNMAFLLPAFSKFLQKHIQVSRFFGWLKFFAFLKPNFSWLPTFKNRQPLSATPVLLFT